VTLFGVAPLLITFVAALAAGVVSVAAGIIMGSLAKAGTLAKAQAEAERARASLFKALEKSGASTLAQISEAMLAFAEGLRSFERGAESLERGSNTIAAALDELARNYRPGVRSGSQMASGEDLGPARAQGLGAEVGVSEFVKLATDTAKGTVGQIPKLDRGAQFVALGLILIIVAAGVGMFVYAVRPAG
jgi:hypothetical protein